MVVYPAQTIFLSIVGCKHLQLMRKGLTWILDQSMRIRIQVLLLEPSSLLGELAVRFHCSSDASVIGLCAYIYKKFMVVVSAYAKMKVYIKPSSQRGGREHKNICFILRKGARIMEKQHSIMIFKVFFAFTIAVAAISHSISLSPDSGKATNAAASCTQDH
ncbi:hypothetical protein Bca4012_077321 [Brassica carinata]